MSTVTRSFATPSPINSLALRTDTSEIQWTVPNFTGMNYDVYVSIVSPQIVSSTLSIRCAHGSAIVEYCPGGLFFNTCKCWILEHYTKALFFQLPTFQLQSSVTGLRVWTANTPLHL